MTTSSSSSSPLRIETSSPVLVTGATGYIAGVLIQQLLENGVTVHATVRDPTQTSRFQYLVDMAKRIDDETAGRCAVGDGSGRIKFFKGDLMEPGSFAEGMKGCSIVFHTASPCTMQASDPQRDLVEPAVQGTRHVLEEATRSGTVQRVVLTSSCAAIYCDNTDTYELHGSCNNKLTEDHWNTKASLKYYPYSYSKTRAEQIAWEIAGSQTNWTLVVMNPCVVLGPGVKYHDTSETVNVLRRLGGGEWKWGCPNVCKGVVDVRDVAHAHIVAAFGHHFNHNNQPNDSHVIQGRYIVAGTNTSFLEMAHILREEFPDYPISPRALPKLLVWLLAPYVGADRHFIWNNIDIPLFLDNTKSKRDLDIHYRPLRETLRDLFQQLIDAGVVHPRGKHA